MKILLLTTHLNPGGITSYLYNLAKGLVATRHTVYLVSAGGSRAGEFQDLGVTLWQWPIRTKCECSWRLLVPLWPLRRLIMQHGIEVIHAHTRVTQVMGAALAKVTYCPVITTCHGFFKRRLSRRIWPGWGRRVIAISPAVQQHLERDFGIPGERITCIRSGIDINDFAIYPETEKLSRRQEYHIPAGPVLGIVARLSEEKGHAWLIVAMEQVVTRFPTARLLIVGQGRMERVLKHMVIERRLEKNVLFYKVVNQTARFLSLLDMFILPSRQEGLGLSVMEAQAAGLPVIASRVGGIPSLIEPGRTGLLVEVGDVQGLTKAILRLLAQPEEARRIGNAARDFVAQHGSFLDMARATEEVYRQAVRGFSKTFESD